MSILREITLRYRAEGHVRFDLPKSLCDAAVAATIVKGLAAREGIYRVDLQPRSGKLSIRFLPAVCDISQVLQRLRDVILAQPVPAIPRGASQAMVARASSRALALPSNAGSGFSHWLREKVRELRETLIAMRILASRAFGSLNSTLTQRPRWVKEFLNDLLMLYLIKLHWHHILTEWLPNPWKHRYEWAATLYLVHLSVQARMVQNA
ncbi:hypothetical protein JCM19379_08830 [Methyloparacoccus murrellii]